MQKIPLGNPAFLLFFFLLASCCSTSSYLPHWMIKPESAPAMVLDPSMPSAAYVEPVTLDKTADMVEIFVNLVEQALAKAALTFF